MALALGALLVPVVTVGTYYVLFLAAWRFMPSTIDAGSLAPDLSVLFEDRAGMASLLVLASALAFILVASAFVFLIRHARRVGDDRRKSSIGLDTRFVKRYFGENLLDGARDVRSFRVADGGIAAVAVLLAAR